MNLYKKTTFFLSILSYRGRSGYKYNESFLPKKTLPHLFKGISYPCSGVCEHVLSNLHFLSAKIHIRLLLDRN